ncbi:hypothetical protein N7507_005021 [Penicillium longicatenatum]|nr:hypothetical protein N7507_005021 [Penicillium longicatenatum]
MALYYATLSGYSERYKETGLFSQATSIFSMAKLAHKLGFRSPQINSILKESLDRAIAKDALLKARKVDRFSYNTNNFETLIERIVDYFNAASPIAPKETISIETPLTRIQHRCGYLTINNVQSYINQLFLN